MSCRGNLTNQGLVGTLTAGYAIPRSLVETQVEDEAVFPNGITTITVKHEKEHYDCWLQSISDYRVSNTVYVHVKSTGVNYAELDIVNTGEEITMSIGKTAWLCTAK